MPKLYLLTNSLVTESKDTEVKANINRFQGSSSISSDEFFGNETKQFNNSTPYDIEDVKESVRHGVTKVANKLSSLANGVMSSIQDRYSY
ncbi:hypothetical protein NQ318_021717 [Aromia moschata]|uniref:Uncharacterized protein n=1 Tax=Aromia moschata TaxID=1265417 RepID=A0AAV8XZT4_9CUCU|nr:hypothetical protein NQ318_021717 [Aromia moschata]